MEKIYDVQSHIRNDEHTQNQPRFFSELISSDGSNLLFLNARAATTKYGETVLVADPHALVGGKVETLKGLWSSKCLSDADVKRLRGFTAVDALVKFGTYVNPETGDVTKAKEPKIVALVGFNKEVFQPTGELREYHGPDGD